MGIMDNYRAEEFHEMKRIEKALVRALMPFAQSTDPLLGVLALARVMRAMLRKAPAPAQKQLQPVLRAYLEGRTSLEAPILWQPGDPVV